MTGSYYPFSFEAPIVHYDVGSEKYAYTVVVVPREVAERLPLDGNPRLRVTGEFNDVPFDAALSPARGSWYLMVSKKMMRAIGVAVGDEIAVRFKIADQNFVDVPPALKAALERDNRLRNLWATATPGKQRGLAYRVALAKSDTTQAKRIDEVIDILEGRLDSRGKPLG